MLSISKSCLEYLIRLAALCVGNKMLSLKVLFVEDPGLLLFYWWELS